MWVKISLSLSPENLYLRISLINFNCISRHLGGVKIKISRGNIHPDPPR